MSRVSLPQQERSKHRRADPPLRRKRARVTRNPRPRIEAQGVAYVYAEAPVEDAGAACRALERGARSETIKRRLAERKARQGPDAWARQSQGFRCPTDQDNARSARYPARLFLFLPWPDLWRGSGALLAYCLASGRCPASPRRGSCSILGALRFVLEEGVAQPDDSVGRVTRPYFAHPALDEPQHGFLLWSV